MKKLLAAIVFVLSLPVLVSAQGSSNIPLITVNGQAEVKVVPDEVELSLGVETSDKSLEVSKSQNDGRVCDR